MTTISNDVMGDVWPHAEPGKEGADYGSVSFSPQGGFEVRSFQTFGLVYTVGEYGLDDTGAIKVAHNFTPDGGKLQFTDPKAANYVTASASNGVRLQLYWEPYGHVRPWNKALRVAVEGGYMTRGDTITIVYGDRSGGSSGYRLQTFCESAFVFKVLVDACATNQFLALPVSPAISYRCRATLPVESDLTDAAPGRERCSRWVSRPKTCGAIRQEHSKAR